MRHEIVMVAVRIPDNLRGYLDGRDLLEIEGACVGDVLSGLERRFPQLAERVVDANGHLLSHLVIIRNDRVLPRCGVEGLALEDGDELRIFSAAAGG